MTHYSTYKLIDLPIVEDPRGNLSFIEENKHLPFSIKRVYWIYDVPGGEKRGGHAFKEQKELIVAMSGSFNVVINDGINKVEIHLNRAYRGLFLPNKLWRHMENFSTNSVALVLSSTNFNENDYIRDFEEFIQYIKHD